MVNQDGFKKMYTIPSFWAAIAFLTAVSLIVWVLGFGPWMFFGAMCGHVYSIIYYWRKSGDTWTLFWNGTIEDNEMPA